MHRIFGYGLDFAEGPGMVGSAGFFILISLLAAPAFPWNPFLHIFAMILLMIGNIALYYTHVNRIGGSRANLHEVYHKLPKELKKNINLSNKTLLSLDEDTAYDLRHEIGTLLNEHTLRQQELAKTSGEVFELRQAVREAIEAERRERQIASSVRESMERDFA